MKGLAELLPPLRKKVNDEKTLVTYPGGRNSSSSVPNCSISTSDSHAPLSIARFTCFIQSKGFLAHNNNNKLRLKLSLIFLRP